MDPIAYTAQIVAAKPAIEQTLPHPQGQDPYAGPLAGHDVDHLLARYGWSGDFS